VYDNKKDVHEVRRPSGNKTEAMLRRLREADRQEFPHVEAIYRRVLAGELTGWSRPGAKVRRDGLGTPARVQLPPRKAPFWRSTDIRWRPAVQKIALVALKIPLYCYYPTKRGDPSR
jgi:hypothetical protein